MGLSSSDLADLALPSTIVSAKQRRPRLEAALDQVPPAGVGVIVAPAGSGKSVLLSQWASRSEGRVCRMNVTASHDDPVHFARALVSAIATSAPEFDPAIADLVAGRALGPAFVNRLRTELEDLSHPLVVVIDDVHLLGNESICADLGRGAADRARAGGTRLPPDATVERRDRTHPLRDRGRIRIRASPTCEARSLGHDPVRALGSAQYSW
ncbi:MAG: AAA family ATPase [Tepidiformaceae bacterium]